jgi:5-methyltetrahydropteroyltriglutamate--homocysteine methyltransferase
MVAQFKADHVGSFLRPLGVKEPRAKFTTASITHDALTAVEDASIVEAIERQKQAGARYLLRW